MNVKISPQTEIRGMPIRSWALNEALIQCKFSLTFSDAKQLCARTKSGLNKNKKLRDLFFDILTNSLSEAVKQKESKVTK